jgi:pimeloyl-ACP methyl ester carboxylesterase
VADAANDTAAILDALQVDTFVTLGWSGGGPHALACAALLAKRCLATAVVAGLAPHPSEVWPDDAFPTTRQGGEAAGAAFEEDQAKEITTRPEDLAAMFPSEPDRACLLAEYAEWLASHTRSAWAAGIAGVRDDNKAFTLDRGFDLAEVRRVTVWQGDQDEMLPPAHAVWLAGHSPEAELRLLAGEGHLSIGLRFPEIVDNLLAGVDKTSRSINGGAA